MSDGVREAIEGSPYARRLGVKLDRLGEDSARLVLPFQDENTNPGGVLHGGVAASLSALGATAVAHAVLGGEALPLHVAQIQVSYLAAAKREPVAAEARLLRRGKTLCFVAVEVATEEGKPIAQASATVRGRFGEAPASREPVPTTRDAGDPGPLGPHVVKTPFMARLGLRVEHMMDARSRLVLPGAPENTDGAGGIHPGALLALLDTTGAMAAWATTGPGPFKASTPSLQARVLAPPPPGDLVAHGRLVARDGDLFWTQVDVAASDGGRVAEGSVLYRIVTS